ncbi:MAG TPA: hypothetical protein VK453_15175 [Micromonosporaceae bacterium]|nr:hypothetical protein [Micromonosporaceae bacterium]
MLSTQWTARRTREAERVAEEAWDNLVAAMESAGHTARSVTRRSVDLADEAQLKTRTTADDVQHKVGAAADEAWRRATAAVDALAGRRAPVPWMWIAGAAVVGAVAGWVGATAVRRALAAADEEDELLLAAEPGSAESLAQHLD